MTTWKEERKNDNMMIDMEVNLIYINTLKTSY